MSDATAEKSGEREFKSNVYPIDNTPDVPSNGLQVSITIQNNGAVYVAPL
jgi:hypothetical protein